MVDRLYEAGFISTNVVPLSQLQAMLSVAAVCRRRLAVWLVKEKMCETVREASTFIEQGHVRIGPDTVTDPGRLVSRAEEHLVQWADRSKIKRQIAEYQGTRDDYNNL